MNNLFRKIIQAGFFSVLFFVFMIEPAIAEDGTREWRPIYDLVMRWINFGILVFFLVKVVGPILYNFLSNQQSEIQGKILRIQQDKEEILTKVRDAKDSLENSGPRLEEIKRRIVEQGERRKQEIIDEANEHTRLMLGHARQRIDNQILQTRKKLMDDLLDMAMEKALTQLPGEITEEDNHRLIQKYLSAASAKEIGIGV